MLRVAFRVDAGPDEAGGDALLRCAALGEILQSQGAQVLFLGRGLTLDAAAWLERRSLAWRPLPPAGTSPPDADAAGQGESWEDDARQTVQALAGASWDWLVADLPGVDPRWERRVAGAARRLLVIDDGARHAHEADLWLQPFAALTGPPGTAASDTAGRLEAGTSTRTQPATDPGPDPDAARRWLGPRWLPLRPEVAAGRGLARPRQAAVQRVLVLFGADAGGCAGKVLRALDALRRDGLGAFIVDAVVDDRLDHAASLSDFCARRPGWACHVNTPRLAELMAAADLAVGEGGTAMWECCALGVPCIVVPQTARQAAQVSFAAQEGWVCAPRIHGDGPEGWRAHIEALWLDDHRRLQMSRRAYDAVDGGGAARVAEAMRAAATATPVTLAAAG